MTGVSRTVPASLSGIASRAGQSTAALDKPVKIAVDNLNFYYGPKRALDSINIAIRANLVTAFIGPSGCGKSTFLRTLNRMNDIIPATRVEGTVRSASRVDRITTGSASSASVAAPASTL